MQLLVVEQVEFQTFPPLGFGLWDLGFGPERSPIMISGRTIAMAC